MDIRTGPLHPHRRAGSVNLSGAGAPRPRLALIVSYSLPSVATESREGRAPELPAVSVSGGWSHVREELSERALGDALTGGCVHAVEQLVQGWGLVCPSASGQPAVRWDTPDSRIRPDLESDPSTVA